MKDGLIKNITSLRSELDKVPKELREEVLESFRVRTDYVLLDAHHSIEFPLGDKSCHDSYLLILSGKGKTNKQGKSVIRLNELLCHSDYKILREPSFVVTPHTDIPAFATIVIKSVPGSIDRFLIHDRDGIVNSFLDSVTVEISTWKHTGNSAENIKFSWISTIKIGKALYLEG